MSCAALQAAPLKSARLARLDQVKGPAAQLYHLAPRAGESILSPDPKPVCQLGGKPCHSGDPPCQTVPRPHLSHHIAVLDLDVLYGIDRRLLRLVPHRARVAVPY